MTASPLEPVRWTSRKWSWMIASLFLFQVILVLLLGERSRSPAVATGFHTRLHLAADESALERIARMPALSDPAAFALPTHHGFSRDGWLMFRRPEFRLSDWSEPPQWLTLETEDLGNSLHQFVLTHTMAPLLIADKPLPSSPGTRAASLPVGTRSDFWVEGELGGWTLLKFPELPAWAAPDLLTNTVVHVLIDAAGNVLSTAMLASSGLAEADHFAVEMVKAARFRPPSRTLTEPAPTSASGKFIFQWHTVPATNPPVGAAAADP